LAETFALPNILQVVPEGSNLFRQIHADQKNLGYAVRVIHFLCESSARYLKSRISSQNFFNAAIGIVLDLALAPSFQVF
jgi:hypothetical protein